MPPPRARAPDPAAEPLHRSALRMLRLLRLEDGALELSAARLSALSVLVFGGPATLGALAAAEQVSAPTMTRLAKELQREGWVRRVAGADARSVRLVATAAATRLLHQGRDRRVDALSEALRTLALDDRRALADATAPLEHLVEALQRRAALTKASAPRSGRRRLD